MEEESTETPVVTAVADEAQKLVTYIMGDHGQPPGHKFLVMRRTMKNAKGRYITAEEFLKVGLLWPTRIAQTRDELALILGQAILDEAGV